ISDSGDYDAVIVDLGSAMTEAHGEVLRRCDAMLWLVGSDTASRAKADAALGYARRTWQGETADWERRLRFVACGHSDSRESSKGRDRSIFGKLPRVRGMRSGSDLRRLLDAPEYRAAVGRLLDKLERTGGGAVDYGADGAVAARAR